MSDDSMGEQMVYDGLTGNDADNVPAKIPTNADAMTTKIPDGVDAGGQAYTVDVETMDMDEGDGSEVLVEPGEVAPPPARPAAPSHPEIPTFQPAVNGNGAQRNGVRPANGAQRNGAPRNRVAAYERAAPLIQGTGAATSREGAQNFEPGGPSGPPNPAAYGYMGQAPAANPLVDLTKTALTAAGQVGSTAILARQGLAPPQFQPAPYDPATAQQPRQEPAKTNYTPWLVGLGVIGLVGIGAWWLSSRSKKEAASPAPAPAAANPRRWNKKAKLRRKKFSRKSSS